MSAQGHLSISQAADHAGVSRYTIRRRMADGTLPAVRVGPRIIRIKPRDLDRLSKPIPPACPEPPEKVPSLLPLSCDVTVRTPSCEHCDAGCRFQAVLPRRTTLVPMDRVWAWWRA